MFVSAANIGNVTSTGGFGIINSDFITLGAGRFGSFTADGLGIRGVLWQGGQSLQSITVNGNGRRVTTTSFEPTVCAISQKNPETVFCASVLGGLGGAEN